MEGGVCSARSRTSSEFSIADNCRLLLAAAQRQGKNEKKRPVDCLKVQEGKDRNGQRWVGRCGWIAGPALVRLAPPTSSSWYKLSQEPASTLRNGWLCNAAGQTNAGKDVGKGGQMRVRRRVAMKVVKPWQLHTLSHVGLFHSHFLALDFFLFWAGQRIRRE